ncbi:hypothetical protein F4780DRAFT_180287 [Xylariomycetidae sp. FL0641]|nr:hypothetical protein F4780DRAFT_180287 [Xylariomycetidae sp. FL0641]
MVWLDQVRTDRLVWLCLLHPATSAQAHPAAFVEDRCCLVYAMRDNWQIARSCRDGNGGADDDRLGGKRSDVAEGSRCKITLNAVSPMTRTAASKLDFNCDIRRQSPGRIRASIRRVKSREGGRKLERREERRRRTQVEGRRRHNT